MIEIRGGGGGYQRDGASDPGSIVDRPVLGVHKTVKERVVRIGHNFTYLIDVKKTGSYRIPAKNLGPGDASNVKINDPPAGSDIGIDPAQSELRHDVQCHRATEITTSTDPVICTISVLPAAQFR